MDINLSAIPYFNFKGVIYIDTYKSVFKPKLARELLRLGNSIYDIKPCKENTDRTIFIFKETEKFQQDMITVLKR